MFLRQYAIDVATMHTTSGCVYYIDIDDTYDAFHMAAAVCGTVTNPVKVRSDVCTAFDATW